MAYIDKIYCYSRKEFEPFWDWCNKFRKECQQDTGRDILDYFYCTPDEIDKKGYYPYGFAITNFSEKIDMWLYRHCPVQFIRDRLREQYGKYIENRI
ncbi:MAG: hypothetical protein LBQ74_20090 [Prevotella sp.]|jgi:hypothetical protein|nr:hypothetical protein [Prevotella sp.]